MNKQTNYQPTKLVFFNYDQNGDQAILSFAVADFDYQNKTLQCQPTINYDLNQTNQVMPKRPEWLNEAQKVLFVSLNDKSPAEHLVNRWWPTPGGYNFYDLMPELIKSTTIREIGGALGLDILNDDVDLLIRNDFAVQTLAYWFEQSGQQHFLLRLDLWNNFLKDQRTSTDLKEFWKTPYNKIILQVLQFHQTNEQAKAAANANFKYLPYNKLNAAMQEVQAEHYQMQKRALNPAEKRQFVSMGNLLQVWNQLLQFEFCDPVLTKKPKGPTWSAQFNFYDLPVALGEGGVHASNDGQIFERPTLAVDVVSYYPNEIVNRLPDLMNWLQQERPPEAQKYFRNYWIALKRYEKLLRQREQLKQQRDPQEQIYKLVVNRLYGLIGAPFSPLYNKQAALTICLNGQLQLLLLVHWLEKAGIVKKWVQLNTDGIHFELIDQSLATQNKYHQVKTRWEQTFGFQLEATQFEKFFNFNVNNFIGQMANGQIKTKGAFLKDYHNTGGDCPIVAKMITNFLLNGQTFNQTIAANPELQNYQLLLKVGQDKQLVCLQAPQQLKWTNQVQAEGLFNSDAVVRPAIILNTDVARVFFSQKNQQVFEAPQQQNHQADPQIMIANYKTKIFGHQWQAAFQQAIINRDKKAQAVLQAKIKQAQNQGWIEKLPNAMANAVGAKTYRQVRVTEDRNNAYFVNLQFPFDWKSQPLKRTLHQAQGQINVNYEVFNHQVLPVLATNHAQDWRQFQRLKDRSVLLWNYGIINEQINDYEIALDLEQYCQLAWSVLSNYRDFDWQKYLNQRGLNYAKVSGLLPKEPSQQHQQQNQANFR